MTELLPTPEITDVNRAYWEGIAGGILNIQCCDACGNRWLPPRSNCPRCLSPETSWSPSSGRGRVISWVVYHTVYHEALKDRVPYNVAVIELDEGARLLSNVTGEGWEDAIGIGADVKLVIDREGNFHVPRFRLV